MNLLPLDGPGRAPEGPLASYARAVRGHTGLVIAAMLAALLGGLCWLAIRPPEYHATARILIDPVSSDDEALLGLPLVRDAGDPTRTAQTAAALLHSPRAAEETARWLGDGSSPTSVLNSVTIAPAGQSNILAVTAAADEPERAARVANGFADATVADRDAQLADALDRELAGAATRARTQESGSAERVERLSALRRSGDPTVALADDAMAPTEASGAPAWMVMVLALVAGLVIGAVAAIVAELRSPQRVADEDELLSLLSEPVLARLPEGWHRFHGGPQSGYMTPADIAFRSLEVKLGLLDDAARTVMVSSPDEGDGKTTVLASLALRLAGEGQPVVAIDLDLHSPSLAHVLGVHPEPGLAAVLEPGRSLTDALVPIAGIPELRVLPGMHDTRLAALARVRQYLPALLAEARASGSHVLIDTSPIGTVGDALLLLDGVDELVIVVRLGHTTTTSVEATRDTLWRAASTPLGFAIIGAEPMLVPPGSWSLTRRREQLDEPGDPAGDAFETLALPPAGGEFASGDRVRWQRGAAHGTGTVLRELPEGALVIGDPSSPTGWDRRYVIRSDTTGKEMTCRLSTLRPAEDDE